MPDLRFSQVDVFGSTPLRGNPVAVVHDADQLSDAEMAQIALWTNLSETTFLCEPTSPDADYRLRIFTPMGEITFAGHPTLGSAHAWDLQHSDPNRDRIVQECGIGLVSLHCIADRWAFEAPPLVRSGPVDPVVLTRVIHGLGISTRDVVHSSWIDNGPGFLGIMVPTAACVLKIRPDFIALDDLCVGVIGAHDEDGPADFEVRAFAPPLNIGEDPVTGSLNAGLAQWLIGARLARSSYTVRQGTAIGRAGDVYINTDDDGAHWIGGVTTTVISGTLTV